MSSASAVVSTSNRWLTTIWKASPALISSTAAATASWNSSGVRCRRIGSDVRRTAADDHRGRRRLGQQRGHRVEPGDGVGVRLVDPFVGAVEVDRVGDQPHLAVVVVEHGEIGGQQEGQLGHLQVVDVAVGQPLDPPDGVVAEEADQPGGERRQPVGPRGVQQAQRLADRGQRVAAGGQPGRGVPGPDGLAVALGQHGRGPHADEGVARPDALLGRLQQIGAGAVLARACGRARRGLGVGQQPPVHRDHPAVARPAAELLQRRGDLGRSSRPHSGVTTAGRTGASKQLRSPVWQAAPSWRTLTSTVSPSQSSRTSRTHCRWPLVSPLTQYSLAAAGEERGAAGGQRAVQGQVVHPAHHQTSPVSSSWTTAVTRPAASRLSRAAICGVEGSASVDGSGESCGHAPIVSGGDRLPANSRRRGGRQGLA